MSNLFVISADFFVSLLKKIYSGFTKGCCLVNATSYSFFFNIFLLYILDMKILKYLSIGETDDTKLGEMIVNHGAILRQAMKCRCN